MYITNKSVFREGVAGNLCIQNVVIGVILVVIVIRSRYLCRWGSNRSSGSGG